MPRDRTTGRFVTAKRTTITESITIGERHPRNDTAGGPTPIFTTLLAEWPNQRLVALETARATANDATRAEAITRTIPPGDDVVAWTRSEMFTWDAVPRPRIYHELEPDTLAHEFADAPLDLLP